MQHSGPALRLHAAMMNNQWKHGALTGPDPGIRLNYRVFRFVKSYLRALPWRDDLMYMQAQGYWALANILLFDLTREQRFLDIAMQTGDTMLARQQPDGSWPYPNPEWRGRVATAEGVWAALGLLELYRKTGNRRFLDGALRWHHFMLEVIGFQQLGPQLAINYFASTRLERIPNNSAFAMRLLAELSDILRDSSYLETCDGMIEFLHAVQKPSGEIPYAVEGKTGGRPMPHFQCYQYNAFQALDLMRYHRLTDDRRVTPLIRNIVAWLTTGVSADGHVAYECDAPGHIVTYHTAAVAAAFDTATRQGFGDYGGLARQSYDWVLRRQRADGTFPHSRGDYRFLSDERAYPRYQAMILYHLLLPEASATAHHEKEQEARSAR